MESHYSDFDDFRQWSRHRPFAHSPNRTRKTRPATKRHLWISTTIQWQGNAAGAAVFFRSSGYLDRHLELSEEQKNMILELTKQSHQRIFEFGEPFREQLREEHRDLQTQIRGTLTPEQTRVFDNLPHFRFNKEPGRPKGRPRIVPVRRRIIIKSPRPPTRTPHRARWNNPVDRSPT